MLLTGLQAPAPQLFPQAGAGTPLPTPSLAGLGPGSREDALKQIEADLEARLAREQAALADGALASRICLQER